MNQSGASTAFSVQAPSAGEYRLLLHYTSTANPENTSIDLNGTRDWPLPAHLGLRVGGADRGAVYFPRTAPHDGAFPDGRVSIPVTLEAGTNTVSFVHREGSGQVELDRAELSATPRI
ncbi:hypothetical protein ABII15_37035 [Streptomyces sp. HUAS MG91]|uniref:Gylcosyl hydrolase 115 C-terminal domain-containing protein n=1 Tax=Streptomyces tabacisoli TaxID=3156398 RepID=A0AAU8J3Y7_9ACTN